MNWGGGVTEVKYPNEGHTPNKGQKPMYQGVHYSESPLYIIQDEPKRAPNTQETIFVHDLP